MKKIAGIVFGVLLFFAANTVVAQSKVCSNPKCHGGKIYCDDCDYTGELNGKTCPKCNGAGSYPCPNCNGKGSVGNGNNNNNSNNIINNNNNSSASHEYTCPECKGEKEVPIRCTNPKCHNGAIYCEACDYKGTISQRCTACDGKGEITKEKTKPCSECNGKKYTMKEKQDNCTHCRNGKVPSTNRRGEKVWVDHKDCNGTGYITSTYKATCRACGGDGIQKKKHAGANGRSVYTRENDVETVKVKCDACSGKGKVEKTCTKCNGKACYPCPTCEGYGNIRKPCSRCNGNGVIFAK
jgi:DnaJ-class molecular chaperone